MIVSVFNTDEIELFLDCVNSGDHSSDDMFLLVPLFLGSDQFH